MTSLGHSPTPPATAATAVDSAPTVVAARGAASAVGALGGAAIDATVVEAGVVTRAAAIGAAAPAAPREVGGRGGLEPVRYGDWELRGRCIDF